MLCSGAMNDPRTLIFSREEAVIFVPDKSPVETALRRTTHLGIGAHHDDLEIMAIDGILRCYESPQGHFTGVVVTDGAGSPRAGKFADYGPEQMKRCRAEEQKRAAELAKYSAQLMLGHPSAEVRAKSARVIQDIAQILEATRPRVVYTHSPFDKHETHVAVVLRVLDALRSMPPERRPQLVYGVEVWRDLDWVPDSLRVVFDCSKHPQLQEDLLRVFESQVAGGKRYDLAALGRRRAHATYLDPHSVDRMQGAVFGVNLSELARDEGLDVAAWASDMIEAFKRDVMERIQRNAG